MILRAIGGYSVLILFLFISYSDEKLIKSDSKHLGRVKRSPVIGIFSLVIKLFEVPWNVWQDIQQRNYEARQEERIINLQDDIGAMRQSLDKIEKFITEFKKFEDKFNIFMQTQDYQNYVSPYVGYYNKMNQLIKDYHAINFTSDLFQTDMDAWTTRILNDETGAKSCLDHLHVLATGGGLMGGKSLFQLYFVITGSSDSYQSRKWKTEAYADYFMAKQAELCLLWIQALQYRNSSNVAQRVKIVQNNCVSNIEAQLEKLQSMNTTSDIYHLQDVPATGFKQICFTSPFCLASGFRLSGDNGLVKPDSLCFSNTSDDSNSAIPSNFQCVPGRKFSHVPTYLFYRRKFSATMLIVPNPTIHTICQLSVFEEENNYRVYIRLEASVCLKNSTDKQPLSAGVPPIRSGYENLREIFWPYKIMQSEFPKKKGWVVGVGLDSIDHSLTLKMITSYFPPIIDNNII